MSTWQDSRLFEYLGGENGESTASWDTYTCTTTASAADVKQGSYALAFVPGDDRAIKYINSIPDVWFRLYFKIATASASGTILTIASVGGTTTDTFTLSYNATTGLVSYAFTDTTKTHALQADYQCLEIQLDAQNSVWKLYLDGVYIDAGTWNGTTDADHLLLTIGSATNTATFFIDAIAVDRNRVGLLDIGPNVADFPYSYDIEIGGIGFNLVKQAGSFKKTPLSPFNPRLGVGSPTYSDLSGFQHLAITSAHNGIGQARFLDEFAYLIGNNIDTTEIGLIRPANEIVDYDSGNYPASWELVDDGFICSETNAEFSLFGLGFYNAAATGSYRVLYCRSATAIETYSFSCTHGIQDILDNGDYILLSLGGDSARMQKSSATRSYGLNYNDGAGGDSITYDDGANSDSVTYASLYTWSDAGNNTSPPYNMGQMAMYDDFIWVAERDTPWLHRAAELDLSDLQGGNPDDDATYDSFAVRVGPGRVPITSMCPYLGKLYIGREDGLFSLTVQGEGVEDIVVVREDEVTRHRNNYRGMTTYNGYLVYQKNGRIFQFNGSSEQDITPKPISATFPYSRYLRFGGFAKIGSYLFTVGATSDESTAKPVWDILVFSAAGWCRLGQCLAGEIARVDAMPMPTVTQNIEGTTYLRVPVPADGDGDLHIMEMDTRLGASGATRFQTTADITLSMMDFGLPLIERLFWDVKLEAENIVPGVNRIKTEYGLDGAEPTIALGTIASNDCNFMMFPDETVGYKLTLKHTFETSDPTQVPILRTTVIGYMDRPETVWGYQALIDLSSSVRESSSIPGQRSVPELRRQLEQWRDAKTPVSFREPDGSTATVFITDCPQVPTIGQGAAQAYVVQLAALITAYTPAAPPPGGLTYTVS